jgi:lipopolysaccharide transport system ATP-binding protein
MAEPVISVRGVGKKYLLGKGQTHDTLRDQITHAARSFGQRLRGVKPADSGGEQILWALQDVSFDVGPGEVIGIIGRNGAGKSTLLKILSQITEPTIGEIHLRGRLASLLEVGTGFHQELTGRENIFLNGAILGMTQAEIRKKFDEIVAFAEVEKFLDTPVKRYSSGMYVRLAFAVAAHLEPEILVVDEVLAVGDASFQSKCLGKMEEVSRTSGRTVLFVSHNMSAVQALCGRVVLLSQGRVKGIGSVDEQVQAYLDDVKGGGLSQAGSNIRLGNSLSLRGLEFTPNPATSKDPLRFKLEIGAQEKTTLTDLHFLIYSAYGARVAIVDLRRKAGQPYALNAGESLRIEGLIDSLPLVEGDYRIGLFINCSEYHGDYLDLASLSLLNRVNPGDNVPYKAVHRGLLELNFQFDSRIETPR